MAKPTDGTSIVFPLLIANKSPALIIASLQAPEKARPNKRSSLQTELREIHLAINEGYIASLIARFDSQPPTPSNIDFVQIGSYVQMIDSPSEAALGKSHVLLDQAALKFSKLTSREMEIVKLLWEGYSTREIAALWHRSELTVTKHRENLSAKLGARLSPRNLNRVLKAIAVLETF